MKLKSIIVVLMFILALAACSSDGDSAETGNTNNEPSAAESSSTGNDARLNADFADALPVQTQLAIGSVQLETTDMPISEAQAEIILPLWQALQALGQSETTADAELTAVLNQIQDEMTGDQIAFIADLELTPEKFQEMRENGEIALGRGRGGQGNGQAGGAAGGGQGGRGQGGGLLGGGQGGRGQGGLLGGGGPPAGGEAPEGQGQGQFLDRITTGATIRMLQTKLGQEVQRGGGQGDNQNNPNFIAANTIAEALGLTIEAYREKFTDETLTPADVIAAEGGDLEAIKASLMEALAETELADTEEFEARIDTYLTGE